MNVHQPWLVITSISAPNEALQAFATGCAEHGFKFLVIGDSKSPPNFELEGCDFWSIDRQIESGIRYAELCPTKHYARKNIGYLWAIQNQASFIRDTDDDNLPRTDFWNPPQQNERVRKARKTGWVRYS